MRIRHKIPSVFSLSMVDVLCCALGCVILLWLLGAKQLDDETASLNDRIESERAAGLLALRGAEDENAKLNERVKQLLIDRDKAVALEARLAERIGELEKTRDTLKTDLTSQQTKGRDLEGRLKSMLARVAELESDLKVGSTKLDSADVKLKGMASDLASEKSKVAAAERRLTDLERDIESRKRDLAGLTRALDEANAARKKLEGTLTNRDKELATARSVQDRLDASEERERFLAKQLKDRADAMATATKAIDTLKQQTTVLRATIDSRFAGIALTGKRVIFLIDMSGSMLLLDENTESPEKWKEVAETVGRLMRSLPALEKYQVITFSTKPTFPLGSEGKWLDHDATASPDTASKALAAIKPTGGTNMYAALESAFKYRGDGLDAIYLLSDGLPNQGEGITAEQKKTLPEVERGQILGRVIRKKLKDDWNKPGKSAARVKINTVGFFYESPDLGAFLWALSRENEGSFVGMSKP